MANAATFTHYTTGNALNFAGDLINFENLNTQHGNINPHFGFFSFLHADYHQLVIDFNNVSGLHFEKLVYDSEIRFQLIVKRNNGRVFRRKLLNGVTIQDINFPGGMGNVAEVTLVIYTVDHNPVSTLLGNLYSIDVEAL